MHSKIAWMNKRSLILPHLVAIIIMMIWSETFVSSKIVLEAGLRAVDLFFLRFLLAYACIWIVCHKKLWTDNWKEELLMVALGLTGGSLYFVLENEALCHSTAGNVSILVGSCPLYTALLVSLFYKSERLGMRQLIGSLMALAGMVLVIFNGQTQLHLHPIGDILAIGAAWSWAFYSLLMHKVLGKYDTLFITRKTFGYGLISVIPYLILQPMQIDTAQLFQPIVIGNVLYLGIIASMLCFFLWSWVLKRIGTVRATNYVYIQSLFTLVWAFILINESITLMAIVGAVILISGMMLALKKNA